jgi:hypothetical protein
MYRRAVCSATVDLSTKHFDSDNDADDDDDDDDYDGLLGIVS